MKTDSKPQELPTTAEIVIRLRKQAEVCKEIDSMVARIDSTIDPERGEHETLFGMAADRLEAADDVFVLITEANERLTKHLEKAEATIKGLLAAVGTHNCSGRTCVGIYGELTGANRRCSFCESFKSPLKPHNE